MLVITFIGIIRLGLKLKQVIDYPIGVLIKFIKMMII